ncbi:MAG: hypothetical protein ACI97K_000224 [Glaciecola sp.]|jgi:hypothetical protein
MQSTKTLISLLLFGIVSTAFTALALQTKESEQITPITQAARSSSVLASAVDSSAKQVPIKVEIIETDGNFQLLRGGKPYQVKGAGIASLDLKSLVQFGGNSVRTWAVDHHAEPAQKLLDRAHAMGITVSLCLEFGKERMDFDYNDAALVAKQLVENTARVKKYKDHPALLTWIVGNEVNLEYTNPKVFDAINDTAKMIKEIDPNHPTSTAIAGFDRKALADIKERAPDLDFVSFQMYADIVNLPKYMKEAGYDKPYFVTEWGSVGHWEVWSTKWGAPVENTSSEKASNYAKSHLKVLDPYRDKAIGNYVFLWGQKQEKTPTWYGMFLASGEKTEAVDVMHYIWNGSWPENRVPRISPITLNKKGAFDNVFLYSGEKYIAAVEAVDAEGDTITYRWEVRAESSSDGVGGDAESIPQLVEGLIKNQDATIELVAPTESGAYRLFVYAFDGHNNAAHANIPFYVK